MLFARELEQDAAVHAVGWKSSYLQGTALSARLLPPVFTLLGIVFPGIDVPDWTDAPGQGDKIGFSAELVAELLNGLREESNARAKDI